jgi:glycosyltransferase involved in cell wall biosynthesis
MKRLTIAIPTYNRSALLTATVKELLPQLTNKCKLVIVDNASPDPVANVIKDLIVNYPEAEIQIHRNRFNVGGACNQMRCFELCDTEWLWILGDDDVPSPYAIQNIFEEMEEHSECVFYNFVCPALRVENKLQNRAKTIVTNGLAEFVNELDHFSSIQFMSLSVYRVDAFIPYFHRGIEFSYSQQGHIAMILMGIDNQCRACFSKKDIIPVHGGGLDKAWPRILLSVTGSILLEMPWQIDGRLWNDKFRKTLSKKILGSVLRLKTLGTILLDDLYNKKRSIDETRFLFTQICSKTFYYEKDFTTRSLIIIYKIIFWVPFIATILRKVPILKKHIFNEKNKL